MIEEFKYFWNNYDFDMVFTWFTTADWVEVFTTPAVAGTIAVVIVLSLIPKTAAVGKMLIVGLPVAGYYFVTFTILRNDTITDVGPFLMALLGFFGIVGWFVWTKLLNS